MISITVMSGKSQIGTPDGTKSLRKPKPFLKMPMSVTPMKTKAASAKVIIMWLVTVN